MSLKISRLVKRLVIGSVVGSALLIGGEVVARHLESGSANDTLFNYFFYDEQQLRKDMIRDGGIFHGRYQVRVNSRGFRDSKPYHLLLDRSLKTNINAELYWEVLVMGMEKTSPMV